MLEELSKGLPIPKWAPPGCRYYNLSLNQIWLRGKFYDHIPYGFYETEASGGRYRKMFDRRPSIRLNVPMTTGDLVSRKLFAGRHAPSVMHEKENVKEALEWLVREARFEAEFSNVAINGQSGSVAICLKIADGFPRMDVYQGRYCQPHFNDAKNLDQMVIAYCVDGSWFLEQNVTTDNDQEKIEVGQEYWYIRIFDENGIYTARPPKCEKWNPVDNDPHPVNMVILSDPKLSMKHNLGFVPVLWLTNLPNGDEPDGRATFDGVLHNCIDLDYDLSQIGRGVKAMVNPQLFVKGRIINYDKFSGGVHVLDSTNMLHLEPDKKMGEQSITGGDAKLLEMSGGGLQAAMEHYVERVKVFTMEIMAANRKDPNTVKGTLSGKAIELIDEDFIDLVQVMKQRYGQYGFEVALKLLGKMCVKLNSKFQDLLEKFKGISEEEIDDLELRWPEMYEPDAQDTQFLATAFSAAIMGGFMDNEQAALIFDMHLDKSTEIFNLGVEKGKKLPGPIEGFEAPKPGAGLPKKEEEKPKAKKKAE